MEMDDSAQFTLLICGVLDTAKKDGRFLSREDARTVALAMQGRQDILDEATLEGRDLTEKEIADMDQAISDLYFELSRRIDK